MEWFFERSEGRGIDVNLGPDWPGFNEALADSVSSMPTRAARRSDLSTYWIDRVLDGIAVGDTAGRSLIFGNSTELIEEKGFVVARSLYDLFDDERIETVRFVELLGAWRDEVIAHRREFRISTTYRRNGFDG